MSESNDRRPVQVVIGATGGIGSATARLLRASEAEVVLAGRNEARLQSLAQEIGGAYCTSRVTVRQ